jgi:hypothetical protein
MRRKKNPKTGVSIYLKKYSTMTQSSSCGVIFSGLQSLTRASGDGH